MSTTHHFSELEILPSLCACPSTLLEEDDAELDDCLGVLVINASMFLFLKEMDDLELLISFHSIQNLPANKKRDD